MADARSDNPGVPSVEETPKDQNPKDQNPKDTPEPPAEEPSKPKETPLQQLAARLPAVLEQAGWEEMWGVALRDAADVPTGIVLQKFLNANGGNVDGAEKQLAKALEWRKKVDPARLVEKAFSRERFGGLGYVTEHRREGDGEREVVVTWNVYGGMKDFKATFGNVDEFIQWRAALMELGVRRLNIASATVPLTPGEDDPYQMVQVHDYLNVSFFRMDPHVKAASRATIDQFSTAYPELLSHKYFVNVPAVMGWVFGVMKLFLAPATLRKFHPMSSGASLRAEMGCAAESFPSEYGGKGDSVKEGETVKLEEAAPVEEGDGAAETETPKPDLGKVD